MGLVIALIVLVVLVGFVIWFVVNRATTGKGGRHGGSTSEISSAQDEGGAASAPRQAADTARPVVGGEAEGDRAV
jgi:hypothetical protein